MIKAELNNYRQSPRKVRLVADSIRGKKAADAVDVLTFMTKRASDPLKKLLVSAIANAQHNFKIDVDSLFVKEIQVNKGTTLHRWLPKARGRATPLNKRSSHVSIILDVKNAPSLEKGAVKAVEKKAVKKVVKKVAKKVTKKVNKDNK